MSVQTSEQVDPTVLSVVVLAFRRARFHLPLAWEAPFLIDFGDGSDQVSTGEHVLEHTFPTDDAHKVTLPDGRTAWRFTVSADDIGQNEGSQVVTFIQPAAVLPTVSGPEVPAPPYVGRPGTLLDTVPVSDSSDPSWTGGFLTRDACPGSIESDLGICVSGTGSQKDPGGGSMWDGWQPFTLYTYYACSPVGVAEQEAKDAAAGTLTAKQSMGVELEVVLAPLRGAALGMIDLATDLGSFANEEQALAMVSGKFHQDEGDGTGVILVAVSTGTLLAADRAIDRVSGRWTAPCGCPVALCSGLDADAFTEQHIIHVGAMKVMAGPVFDLGVHVSDVNTRSFIVERTFGVAWNCDPVMATVPAIASTP